MRYYTTGRRPKKLAPGTLRIGMITFMHRIKIRMTDGYTLNLNTNGNLKMSEADWIQILRSLKRDIEEFEHESLCKETVEQFNSLLQKAKKDLGRKLKHLEESMKNPNEPEKAQLIRKISELLEYLDKSEM